MRKGYVLLLGSVLLSQPSQKPLPEAERTQWFREAKFGMFIHWGVYSVIARHEWARHRFQIPQADYDKYVPQFNPVNFNADAWVDIAKNAGARYIVITSKHHDGFSIYRSKVSDYDIELTPYKGDPMKMLADTCARKGVRFGFYHSIMDWHHPDYRPRRAWEYPNPNEGGDNMKFIAFMKEQLRELLTGYGDIAVVWFDGEWEHTLRDNKMDDNVYDFIRGLQPNTLINDRLYERKPGNRADFGTPEQFVPATGVRSPDGKPVLWEACVTINNDSWGYNKYETEFKTTRDLIRMLVEVVSKGGNLLLNVGPTPDGRIQPEFVTRLAAMGEWMKINNEAIYATTASPFEKLPFFGRVTVKEDQLYLHVFQWPADGRLRVPGLKNNIVSARLLADAAAKVTASRDGGDVIVQLPKTAPDETVSVVALKLDGAPNVVPSPIRPDAHGVVSLGAEGCEIESRLGQRAKKENALGHVYVTDWIRPDDIPTWEFVLPKAGRYKVEISYGSHNPAGGKTLAIEAGSAGVTGTIENSGGDWVFKKYALGEIDLPAGAQKLQIKSADKSDLEGLNFERVTLTPAR